jgi:hypothetical protein
MAGFQVYNLVSSIYSVAQTGNWGAFAGSMAGGMIGGYLGGGLAGQLAGVLGKASFTFAGGFAIGAVEMGMAGFGSGLGGALAGGASLSQAFQAALIAGAIGAVTGGLIEGSYAAGWQHTMHGMDYNELGKASGVQREVSLQVVKRDLPFNERYGKDAGKHWGIRISDNYNEYSGTWDFNFEPTAGNFLSVGLGHSVPAFAGATSSAGWGYVDVISRDYSYVINVYGNIQQNIGSHYYNLSTYNCQDWVNNRRLLSNDGYI